MSDLLQSQIKESCKLALPEGLKDLMSDISREVSSYLCEFDLISFLIEISFLIGVVQPIFI